MSGTGRVQVSTTAPSGEVADAIASMLVERRLAACVQIVGPIRSHYRWEGQVEHDVEWLCLAKTSAALVEALTQAILASHPYDEPEVVATPIVGGSEGYLRWIGDEVGPA